ncbi:MAG: PrsW family intramembrane metalloprotease [Candidatus Methylomirabilales bacterium]
MTFLVVLVGVVPALIVLFYFRARDDYATRAEAVWGAFGIGACVLIPAVVLELLPMAVLEHLYGPLGQSPDNLYATGFLKAFTVAALPEEAFKLLAVLCYAIRHIDCRKPHDIVVLSVAVATGFAAFENVGYLFEEEAWPGLAVARTLTAVPGHAFTGAVMGGCLAAAELGGRRWFYWPAAYIVPVLLHGFYDFPLFVLLDIEARGLVVARSVAPLCILGGAGVLILEGLFALFCSQRVLAAERHKGIAPEHPGVGRLLGWWVARWRLQRAVWGISGILFTAGGLLLLIPVTPFLVSSREPSVPFELQLVAASFALFALLYGAAFLYQARSVSKRVSPQEASKAGTILRRFKPSAPVSTGEIGGVWIAGIFVSIVETVAMHAGEIGTIESLFLLTAFVVWYAWLSSTCLRAIKGNHMKGKGYEGKGHWFPKVLLYLMWFGTTINIVRGMLEG